MTDLYLMCKEGKVRQIEEYFSIYSDKVGLSEHYEEDDENTPLHVACANGHHRIVEILMDEIDHEHICARNKYGETPLHLACAQSNQHVVKVLLKKLFRNDLVEECHGKKRPLHVACENGNYEIVKLLLGKLHDYELIPVDDEGNTPLHLVKDDEKGSITRLLVTRLSHSHLIMKNNEGDTPLHKAMQRWQNAKPLLEVLTHDDLLIKNKKGYTPLHMFISGEIIKQPADPLAFRLLLERLKPCDMNIPNNYDVTPLQRATRAPADPAFVKLFLAFMDNEDAIAQFNKDLPVVDPTNAGYANSKEIRSLAHRYIENPRETKRELRIELGINQQDSARVFSMVVGLCDDYFLLENRAYRFFAIVSKLPMELQMLVCNRAFDCQHDVINKKYIDAAFLEIL